MQRFFFLAGWLEDAGGILCLVTALSWFPKLLLFNSHSFHLFIFLRTQRLQHWIETEITITSELDCQTIRLSWDRVKKTFLLWSLSMQDRLLQVQLHIYKCLFSFFQFLCCSEGPDNFVFTHTHHVACVFMYYGHSVGAMHERPHVCRRTHWTVRKLSGYLTVFLKVQDC